MATNTPEWRESHKEDLRKYRREWYARNKEHAKSKIKERQKEIQGWLQGLKKTLACKCGITHHALLTFHHRDPSEKEIDLAHASTNGWSKKRILKEIEKCDVLCFNCHALHHYEERTRNRLGV